MQLQAQDYEEEGLQNQNRNQYQQIIHRKNASHTYFKTAAIILMLIICMIALSVEMASSNIQSNKTDNIVFDNQQVFTNIQQPQNNEQTAQDDQNLLKNQFQDKEYIITSQQDQKPQVQYQQNKNKQENSFIDEDIENAQNNQHKQMQQQQVIDTDEPNQEQSINVNDVQKLKEGFKIPQHPQQKHITNQELKLKEDIQIQKQTFSQNSLQQNQLYRKIKQLLEKKQNIVAKWRIIPKYTQKQLPFCIITQSDNPDIQKSIKNQKYSNYRLLQLNTLQPSPDTFNLTLLNNQVRSHCLQNSIILFHAHPLPDTYLSYLSKVYQTRKVWATYAATNKSVTVTSAYQRLFYLAAHNNLTGNEIRQTVISRQSLVLSVLEMGLDHLQEQSSQHMDMHSNNVLQIKYSQQFKQKDFQYQPLMSMKQFIKRSRIIEQQNYNKFLNQKQKNYQQWMWTSNKSAMVQAMQYIQMMFLPQNHSIAQKQYEVMENKYKLSQYSSEKPLCIFIPSNNNIQDHRYQKVILSIFQQNYSNYHLVFVDDYSTDQTLKQTIKFVQLMGFPRNRIAYIQNLHKNFATYNIVNGAFNYCQPDDIMVLLDGDDQLIGRQVFRLINYAYQHKPNWLVYTTFMSNLFTYGTSLRKPKTQNDYYNFQTQRRKANHWIGHLTTFYSKFLRQIKLEDHQCIPGEWYQTIYDDAMQHPFLEMGNEHIQFIPQITYLYNKNYGNNDDSAQWKRVYRKDLYWKQIIKRKKYERIKNLQQENNIVKQEIQNGQGVRYQTIRNIQDIIQIKQDVQMNPQSPCRKYIQSLQKL